MFAVSAWGQAKSTFQDLYVIDDTTLGSSSGDSLTINAATTYAGPLLFGDGTVSAPAVSFSSDTDVGMWRSAANTLNFSVGGAEVCEFGATANSIGNASDTTTLLGFLRIGTGATFTAASGDDDLGVEDCLEVDGEAQFDGIIDANSTSDFAGDAVFNEDVELCVAADDKVTFTSGYFTQFRIGTGATPATAVAADNAFIEGQLELDGALDADSTSDFAGDAVFNEDVSLCVGSDDKVTFTDGYFTQFRIGTGATPDITLGTDGAFIEGTLEVDGVMSVSAGAVGAPAIYSAADADTGIWWSAADTLNLSVGGAEVAEFGATANSLGNASDITTVLGGLRIGTGGTPGVTHGDDDLYVEGTAEVDGVVSVSAGAVGAPAIYCTDDTNTGVWSSAADTLNLSVGGVEVAEWGATANSMGNASDTTTLLGFVRVGTGASFGSAAGDDDLGVEDCLEVDGECRLDGIVDANSTSNFADTMVLSKGTGDALQVSAGGTADLDGNLEVAGVVSYGVGTLGDTDLTPDVSSATVWLSQSNTGATTIADLDNPVVGAFYTIIVNHSNNPPAIADAGNFKLSAAWNPDIDDSITLFVRADNDYVEVSRSGN
uniref:Uncharacterized protein n=1 Tax=viral metagenome TaxID=1070528 RepID=A0A6M3II02_9ZZZZ